MADRNEAVVREACEASSRGDVARVLEFIDPEPEWTYLNPGFENPEPETCHGGTSCVWRWSGKPGRGLASQIEEIAASGGQGDGAHPHARHRPCARPPGRGPQLPCPDV